VQPAVNRKRYAAAVGMLDLRPCPAGQRVLVEFPDHAKLLILVAMITMPSRLPGPQARDR
jgi:hypothetical protein